MGVPRPYVRSAQHGCGGSFRRWRRVLVPSARTRRENAHRFCHAHWALLLHWVKSLRDDDERRRYGGDGTRVGPAIRRDRISNDFPSRSAAKDPILTNSRHDQFGLRERFVYSPSLMIYRYSSHDMHRPQLPPPPPLVLLRSSF